MYKLKDNITLENLKENGITICNDCIYKDKCYYSKNCIACIPEEILILDNREIRMEGINGFNNPPLYLEKLKNKNIIEKGVI